VDHSQQEATLREQEEAQVAGQKEKRLRWEFEFPFPGSLTSTFLNRRRPFISKRRLPLLARKRRGSAPRWRSRLNPKP